MQSLILALVASSLCSPPGGTSAPVDVFLPEANTAWMRGLLQPNPGPTGGAAPAEEPPDPAPTEWPLVFPAAGRSDSGVGGVGRTLRDKSRVGLGVDAVLSGNVLLRVALRGVVAQDSWAVDAELPVLFIDPENVGTGPQVMGDPSIGARGRVFGEDELSLGLGLRLSFPVHTTLFGAEPTFLFEWRFLPNTWLVMNHGVSLMSDFDTLNVDYLGSFGAVVRPYPWLDLGFSVEALVRLTVDSPALSLNSCAGFVIGRFRLLVSVSSELTDAAAERLATSFSLGLDVGFD